MILLNAVAQFVCWGMTKDGRQQREMRKPAAHLTPEDLNDSDAWREASTTFF